MGRVTVLRGLKGSTYPGSGTGFVENLSFYREHAKPHDKQSPHVLIDERLAFDIERHVSWDAEYNLKPFTYSMMIDGYFPISFWPWRRRKSRPTKEEFVEIASHLDGFILYEEVTERTSTPWYINPEKNIFINWGAHKGRICLGVIQERPIPDLCVVTDEIVPYAVSLFNQLSPTTKLEQAIVAQSIKLAYESDKIIPICKHQKRNS